MNIITHLTFRQRFLAFAINFFLLVLVHRFISGSWVPGRGPEDVWFFGITAYWVFYLLAAPTFTAPRDTLNFSLVGLLLLVILIKGGTTHFIKGFDSVRGILVGFYVFTSLTAVAGMLLKFGNKNKYSLSYRIGSVFEKLSRGIGESELALVPLVLVSVQYYHQWTLLQLMALSVIWTALRPAGLSAVFTLIACVPSTKVDADVDVKQARRSAKSAVNTILEGEEVPGVSLKDAESIARAGTRPAVLFFYVDNNPGSSRLATLIRALVPLYKGRIDFYRVEVEGRVKPKPELKEEFKNLKKDLQKKYTLKDLFEIDRLTRDQKKDLRQRFGLDNVPGLLFYKTDGKGARVLADEVYPNPDFAGAWTLQMFFWKTYFSALREKLEKLFS